jgi:hypothetical protein
MHKHRTRTLEEYVASLRYNVRDALEALQNAVAMHDWRGVAKYARQLEALGPKLSRAEAGTLGPRRTRRIETALEEQRRRYNLRQEEKERRARGGRDRRRRH